MFSATVAMASSRARSHGKGPPSAVEGGYRVNGRWQFCSGVDHSEWVMLGCADPKTRGPGVHLVVPRAEIEIDDTWHVMGLQGTGSKDVVAHDIFVPAHRAIETRALFIGASPYASKHATNLYRLSAEAMLATSGMSALVGQAKTALRAIHRAHARAQGDPDRRAQGRSWTDPGSPRRGGRRSSVRRFDAA